MSNTECFHSTHDIATESYTSIASNCRVVTSWRRQTQTVSENATGFLRCPRCTLYVCRVCICISICCVHAYRYSTIDGCKNEICFGFHSECAPCSVRPDCVRLCTFLLHRILKQLRACMQLFYGNITTNIL